MYLLILPAVFKITSHKGIELNFSFYLFIYFSKQKLLEEIEKNKDKVDECQKYAKAYIDTIKVSVMQH